MRCEISPQSPKIVKNTGKEVKTQAFFKISIYREIYSSEHITFPLAQIQACACLRAA